MPSLSQNVGRPWARLLRSWSWISTMRCVYGWFGGRSLLPRSQNAGCCIWRIRRNSAAGLSLLMGRTLHFIVLVNHCHTPPCPLAPVWRKRSGRKMLWSGKINTLLLRCNFNLRPDGGGSREPPSGFFQIIKSLNARQSYTDWTIALKLSAIDIHTSIYEMFISEFWYRWPKVRSILRPLHYKSMG